MLAVLLQSVIRQFGWWISSLWPGRHEGAPLGPQRLVFLLLLYPLFLFLQLVHWLGFLCDELIFTSYRKVKVSAPVFVLGIPRSGTTFLHRTLAADRARFTSFSTWEAVLAPSITERKLLGSLRAADRALGSPLYKLVQKLLGSASGDFNEIHEVGLSAPEEDYLGLLPAASCFIMLLAFPYASQLRQLAQLDTMPEHERTRLLDFYKSILQRHLYCHPGKTLLSKNAAFSTWGLSIQSAFPDAKFLICVRRPGPALSSQLSSLAAARSLFGTDPDGSYTARIFTDIYAHSYPSLARFVESSAPTDVALVEQSEMRATPAGTIRNALRQINLKEYGLLDHLEPGRPSCHNHHPDDFPVNQEQIERCMEPAYEAMLRSIKHNSPKEN